MKNSIGQRTAGQRLAFATIQSFLNNKLNRGDVNATKTMKKSILILAILFPLWGLGGLFAQTIRRCNNNPGVTGVNMYTTIQAAHDAAVAGDIIYVEPSDNDYGAVDIRKRLTIIGNGYYLDKSSNVSFDTRTSKLSTITFNNGSANSILTGVVVNSSCSINDVSITITRCKLSNVAFGVSTNLVAGQNSRGNNGTITKCIVNGGNIAGQNSATVANQYGYNCAITNNIMFYGVTNMTNSVISNNAFYTAATGGGSTGSLFGCSVSNNIYDARGLGSAIQFVTSGSGNTISNNICLGQAATPSGNGNVNFGDETITFLVSNPWTTASTEDSKFQLGVSSPAIGVGSGGTNAGAFGGASPYVLSGMPAYPVITNYVVSGVGNASTPLNVSVTVRGNN